MSYMGQHFMLLLSIYVLYSNVTYIYPVSCLVEINCGNCEMSYQTFVNGLPLYTDATPNQIGIVAPDARLAVLKTTQPILENELIGIFISHIIKPRLLC